MKILDTVRSSDLSLSFEVFPPKTDAAFEEVLQATEEIAALKPSFISVTYGAGGAGGKYTMEIARRLQNADGVETLAHLTCVGAGKEDVKDDTDKQFYEYDPFATIDQEGVGKLMQQAAKLGRSVRPNIRLGICGEHGGDPKTIAFCQTVGLNYVSCSPYRVPIARLAAAQAAID